MENQINPQQALAVLEEATSHLKLNRQEQQVVIQSLQVLAAIVNPPVAEGNAE
jgi:hypothetical protein